jgi:BMFP domain-containing protein YqiC
MTRPALDATRARCDAATPGPWRVDGSTYDEDCNEHLAPYGLEGPNGRLIWSSGGGEYAHPDMATAQFIAHSREDVKALLACIEELESRTSYTVGETEWAHRIANAEQRFVAAEREIAELKARITTLEATR